MGISEPIQRVKMVCIEMGCACFSYYNAHDEQCFLRSGYMYDVVSISVIVMCFYYMHVCEDNKAPFYIIIMTRQDTLF